MYSLIDLNRYKPLDEGWGGYVLELAKEGAIYVGISKDLDNRIRQHMEGRLAAKFVRYYGLPVRLIELYFCKTEAQARQWESTTAKQLESIYTDRPVYYPGIMSKCKGAYYKCHPTHKIVL